MSGKVSVLKKIINSITSQGDEETVSKFIYFWDDLIQDELELEKEKPEKSEFLKDNQLVFTSLSSILLAISSIILAVLNQITLLIVSISILLLVLIISYVLNNTNYRRVLTIVSEKSERLKNLDFTSDDEFLFRSSENKVIDDLGEFRLSMNTNIQSMNYIVRDMNFQFSEIENRFSKTSSSLGQANISIDQSIASVAKYQEIKGFLSLSSTGIDNLISAFDDSISLIFEIIKLLKSLGKQTQMLALNAGIEATRSAEIGEGFEVVASNLRRLSLHVTNSANGLKDQISGVSERAKESLENITGSMQQLSLRIDQTHNIISSISNDINSSSHDFNNVQTNNDKLLNSIKEIEKILSKFKL